MSPRPKSKKVMVGVTLSPEEEALLDTIASYTPFASRHRRLLGALRLGLAMAADDPTVIVPHMANRWEVQS